MGGLRKKIPITFWTMCCAWVAISGIPPFSGFFSKDAILAAAYERSHLIYWIGVITGATSNVAGFRYDTVSGSRVPSRGTSRRHSEGSMPRSSGGPTRNSRRNASASGCPAASRHS